MSKSGRSGPIGSGGTALWRKPDDADGANVHRRIMADVRAAGVNDDQLVVDIHSASDLRVGLFGAEFGVDVKE